MLKKYVCKNVSNVVVVVFFFPKFNLFISEKCEAYPQFSFWSFIRERYLPENKSMQSRESIEYP